MFLGETAELQATAVLSDNSRQAVDGARATWRSSNPRAATVSAGVVTAAEPGNTEITVEYGGVAAELPVPVRIAPDARGKVRVIYAAPADRPFRADFSRGISAAIAHAQSWFRRELGGLTFELATTTPEFCQMPEDSDYYGDGNSWDRVVEGLQHCAPVAVATPGISWYVFADVRERCGQSHDLGASVRGLTLVPRHDLELLVNPGTYETCQGTGRRTRASVAGGFGHEIAHSFGVPHPPGCDEGLPHCDEGTLMHLGLYEYPDAYLRPEERELLMRSRFVTGARARASTPATLSIQGVIRDPSDGPLPGIRVSAMSDRYWDWDETGPDGAFSIAVPDRQSGPFLVSAHAGQTPDCNWLGYYGPDGLHSSRREATLVAVAGGDPESLDMTLPLTPDELCNMDRTLSGTVLGPDGRPREGVWIYFDGFVRTALDGTWRFRLFEGWWTRRLNNPIKLSLPECVDRNYYISVDGFTERSFWAHEAVRRFEVGPLGVTGIEVRLPASPLELCRQS